MDVLKLKKLICPEHSSEQLNEMHFRLKNENNNSAGYTEVDIGGSI